ncbi:4-hydroxy-3-methylbut-2-enyl diphosphate reductase [Geminisphaera colitermitum]|uniref:4-hydroxy-3-methylbut-2-enyl diphosphate reductase n=1 Tax=Geminisphaera colitermitum TaxID=1148786 RepID=UPI0006948C15|nr:4-hydroxy-3-methylbut-2-enyl diphosphate reductase [Geminisphaera colitermitum]
MPDADALTLCFDANNRLAVHPEPADTPAHRLAPVPPAALVLHPRAPQTLHLTVQGNPLTVHLARVLDYAPSPPPGISPAAFIFRSFDDLAAHPAALTPRLAALLPALEPHLIDIPYLHLGENDFIYKFRPEKERNTAIYAQDPVSSALYQSQLCTTLKTLARRVEGAAADPTPLDFGAVCYLIPSHFGFCLGVKNAIERAYEALAANPGRRVFMLSELIHNPFVNEDLIRRGLRYLQTDKGIPYTVQGTVNIQRPTSNAQRPSINTTNGAAAPHFDVGCSTFDVGRSAAEAASAMPRPPLLLWDTLTPDDIVIIPAFGATDDDKRRLIRKGIALGQSDATCMLVEKVWKAARAYGRAGYTVIIHGKSEHEETKATFANTQRHAPAVIVRNLAETRLLGDIITSPDPAFRATFYQKFVGRHTPGFDVNRHLDRVAVVNQTTLLMNETRGIITYLRDLYAAHYGPDQPGQPARLGGAGRTDTLCYATQVNQDALGRALQKTPIDAALVIGGKNSSNTWQLHRVCEQKLGPRAHFIQSERNIHSLDAIEHYHFPAHKSDGPGRTELRPLCPAVPPPSPLRILVTGGASCPDGLIQQVITRINSLFPPATLRPIDAVLADLQK